MKKLLVLVLILAGCAMLFAGAGQQSAPASGAGQRVVTQVTPQPLKVTPQYGQQDMYPQPATSYSTNPKYPQQPAISNRNGFPITQNLTTITLAIPYYSYVTDYDNNDIIKYMEQLTNVHVQWNILPETDTRDRIVIMLAGGDVLPDAFWGCSFNTSDLITFGAQGLFIPLQDLIQDNCYDYLKLWDANPAQKAAAISADGNIYSLTAESLNEANQVAQRFWVYQPFLDALGMKMPTTTDEYYQFLVGVKTKDPNKNGKADEIPLITNRDTWFSAIDGFLMQPFIYNHTTNYASTDANGRRRMLITPDGKIDVSYNKPEWRDGLTWMNKLYSEGLMSSECFTLDRNGLRSLVEIEGDPIVASIPNGGYHEFANTTGQRRTEYRIMPPLIGPKGVQECFYDEYSNINLGRLSITNDCKIPEIVLKYADYWYTEDMGTRNRYGVLCRDWSIPPAGTPAVEGGDAKYQEILKWGTPQNAYIAGNGPAWNRFASYDRALSDDPYELELVLWNGRNLYWPYRFMRSVPGQLPFTLDEARENTQLNQDIIDYVDQSLAEFITGRTPLTDANWNAYVQQIDKLGLARLLAVNQSAFDRAWAQTLGYKK